MQVKYLTEKLSEGKILRRDRKYRMRSSNIRLIGVPEDNRGNGGKESFE